MDHLAIIFGITYDELRADLAAAADLLAPIGYVIRTTCTGVIAERAASPQADEMDARLNQFRDARDGMLLNHAQVLYKSITDGMSTRGISNDERVSVAYLTARGALAPPASNQRATASADTRYCLFPPDKP